MVNFFSAWRYLADKPITVNQQELFDHFGTNLG